MSDQWFDVDRRGLEKLLAKKGKAYIVFELIQNAWDTDTTWVRVQLTKQDGRPFATLVVEDDDPQGFQDLAHAYTLFAESGKKIDPSKRGRFNLGEKLVLAACREACVSTTTGTIRFNEDGSRTSHPREKRSSGSRFEATVRMNATEFEEACNAVGALIPPDGIATTFNGTALTGRPVVEQFEATLATEIADAEGNLRRSRRKTLIRVYEPAQGEAATIYELGIPVVATGDRFHVDVQQKVPLTMERDNVPPAFLRELRTQVLNHTFDTLEDDEAAEPWVAQALANPDVADEAVRAIVAERFGPKRAIFDPRDQEANHRLASEGYQIIYGGQFDKATWATIKRAGAALPSGKISPTPEPYSDDPEDDVSEIVPVEKWTPAMRRVCALAQDLAAHLLGVKLAVKIVKAGDNFAACYGHSSLDFNLTTLGVGWFDAWPANKAEVLDLLIHEFAHHSEGNHLAAGYHEALSRLGGKMAALALEQPQAFDGQPPAP